MQEVVLTSPIIIVPQIKEAQVKTPSPPEKGILITFSGFSENHQNGFTNKEKDILVHKIQKLGGEVVNDFQKNKFTHMITPPGSKTMKSLAASLTSKWMITDLQWIHHSALAGHFLPEDEYGKKFTTTPFKGKKVFKSKSFIDEHQEKTGRLDNCQNLVGQLGKGIFVNSIEEADLILTGTDEDDHSYEKAGKQCLTWNKMIESIPGPSIVEKKGNYSYKPEKSKEDEQKHAVESENDHSKEKK